MIAPRRSDLLWVPVIFAWVAAVELLHWLLH